MDDPSAQQRCQHQRRHQRPERVGLHLPEEVKNAQRRRKVGQPMQLLPALPQPPNPSPGRGDGQGNHEHQPREPRRDVPPLHHVFDDVRECEELVHAGVGEEVQTRVKEREQPQQAPHLHKSVPLGQAPQRRDRQHGQEERQRPPALHQDDLLDGVGPQRSAGKSDRQPSRGRKPRSPHGRLEKEDLPGRGHDLALTARVRSASSGPCPGTSAPLRRRTR